MSVKILKKNDKYLENEGETTEVYKNTLSEDITIFTLTQKKIFWQERLP